MKKGYFYAFVIGMGIMVLNACQEKDVYVPKEEGVTDLVVPEGFDWKMSEDVSLTVSSEVETSVSVFLSEDCEESGLVATFNASENTEMEVSVPKGTGSLYVRYFDKNEEYKVIPVSLAAVTRATDKKAEVRLPEDVKGNNKPVQEVLYYPSKRWGTLLFEDKWPELGDYDFNDLAAWYIIQVYLSEKYPQETVEMMVSVRLNALGGSLPYQLCLQLDNLKTNEISKCYLPGGYDNKLGDFEIVSKGEEPAVIAFNWKGLRGSKGGNFYNTEEKYSVNSVNELKDNQVTFMIELTSPRNIQKNFKHDAFNFFLRKENDGTEIHLMGYAPTLAYKSMYEEMVEGRSDLDPHYYYRNKEGFVWGLKVPDAIDHAQETVDFCKAYKFFEKWVRSKGEDKKNWYKEQAGKEYRIQVSRLK